MTVKLPPGMRLGKDGTPGAVIADSDWPPAGPDESNSTYDERAEGEATQPGDTVIEMRDGVPTIHTEPAKGSSSANSRKGR
jgi:hypothetical protein